MCGVERRGGGHCHIGEAVRDEHLLPWLQHIITLQVSVAAPTQSLLIPVASFISDARICVDRTLNSRNQLSALCFGLAASVRAAFLFSF